MGADIHMVLERKANDRWVGLHSFDFLTSDTVIVHTDSDKSRTYVSWRARTRNYDRFAALAGVRGKGPAPKGVPDDVSDLARMRIDDDGSDGHSHTWYLVPEALPIFQQTEGETWKVGEVINKLAGTHVVPASERYFGLDENMDGPLSNYRLIIWFDN